MTDGNDPIIQTIYRQTGKDSYRPATEKEIKEGIYLVHKEGLNKREHFAAMAMQGLFAGLYSVEELTGWNLADVAVESVRAADALIAELNKTETA